MDKNYIDGLRSDLDGLYVQKGTIIVYDLTTGEMRNGSLVDTTVESLADLDRKIDELRGLIESGECP